jgi:hypothetical protein
MLGRNSIQGRLNLILVLLLGISLGANMAGMILSVGPRSRAEANSVVRLSQEFIARAIASLQETRDPEPASCTGEHDPFGEEPGYEGVSGINTLESRIEPTGAYLGVGLLSKLFRWCPSGYGAYKTNQKYAAIVFEMCKLNRLHTVHSVQDMDLFPSELKSSHGCQTAEVCWIM